MELDTRSVDDLFDEIITREDWGAPPNTADRVALPYREVVIHTEAGAVLPGDWDVLTELATVLSLTEREHVRAIDRYHRITRGWVDGIGYSFLIERDGTIIEGRGWGRRGAHTQQGRNTTAVGICFAGHGDLQAATGAQWAAARRLIAWGIRIGALVADYALAGHRAYAAKSCPGNLVFPHLNRLRGVTASTNHGSLTMADINTITAQLEDITTRLDAIEAKVTLDVGIDATDLKAGDSMAKTLATVARRVAAMHQGNYGDGNDTYVRGSLKWLDDRLAPIRRAVGLDQG